MIGGLLRYLRDAKPGHFQPMNSNWGLVDPLEHRVKGKRPRREALAERAQEHFLGWMTEHGISLVGPERVEVIAR
jgi:methylenetetrahydrofolate--tRNA-(uracil-5-)-methyltransferase